MEEPRRDESRFMTYYFIVNAASRTGKSKKIWKALEAELKRRNTDYRAYLTKYPGHAGELAEKLTGKHQKQVISLVVVGGDGTANGADIKISALFEFRPPGHSAQIHGIQLFGL